MVNAIREFFDSSSFMPHASCYLWVKNLIRLHLVSDSIIALAYYSIPLTLVYFVRKRRGLPYWWMFLMFSAFIIACGTTHLMEVITLYTPVYWVSGAVKLLTAALSLTTAIMLIPLVPEALTLRTPAELRELNKNLQREIEQRRQAEERVVKLNENLASSNKELEAFSYSVSHDLRTPLRAIDGFSREVLEDYEDKLDERGKSDLKRIRVATQRMSHLIDDLLNLSRITRSELTREKVNLSLLVNQLIEELRATSPGRTVASQVAADLMAEGDPRLLRIVLENLIGNAWKFTQKQPQANIEFGLAHDNGIASFFVRDNGVGFNPAYGGKLFGVFQRLHDEKQFQGTGIGLALVQRIIQRHGGKIWAEAEENRGATFHFTLPSGHP